MILSRNFFTTARIAGILLLLSLMLLIVGVGQVYIQGKLPGMAAGFQGVGPAIRDASGLQIFARFAIPYLMAQLAGFALFTAPLKAGDRGIAVVALTFLVVSTTLSAAAISFQSGVTVWAARQAAVPEFYEPLRRWINYDVQRVYISFQLTALLLFSWSALHTKAISPWIGWTALGWCLFAFAYYFRVLAIPAVVLPVTLLLGIGLVLRGGHAGDGEP